MIGAASNTYRVMSDAARSRGPWLASELRRVLGKMSTSEPGYSEFLPTEYVDVDVWYALGAGKHWVGAVVFEYTKFPRGRGQRKTPFWVCSVYMTLRGARGWSTAENKVLRTFDQGFGKGAEALQKEFESRHGTGDVRFLLFAKKAVEEQVRRWQTNNMNDGLPVVIELCTDEQQRQHVYRKHLSKYGFEPTDDGCLVKYPGHMSRTNHSIPVPSDVAELCSRRWLEASRQLGLDPNKLRFEVDNDYPHFKKPRGYAVTFGNADLGHASQVVVRLSTKCLSAPKHRLDGVVRHELGHVLDFLVPRKALTEWAITQGVALPQHGDELRADALAAAVWGSDIRYEPPLFVQSTRNGVVPRPRHLGA